MEQERPRLRFIKYCRGYFLNRKKRREEKKNLKCNECKNVSVDCKCFREQDKDKKNKTFIRKAKICGLISDEDVNDDDSEDNCELAKELNSLKDEVCEDKVNDIREMNI
jgi:hypothetical protein